MGWKPPQKIYNIVVKDGEYEGLKLKVGSVPLGQFLELESLAQGIENSEKSFEGIKDILASLGNALIEWNIDDTTPDLKGLNSLDFDLVLFIIGEWLGAVGGVSDPLEMKPNISDSSNDEVLNSLETSSHPLLEKQT